MNAQMKYWVWIVLWSCSCLLAAMMQGNIFASAHDDAVKNDAMSYWETRLHGARLPTSVRAMVSPLSSTEATQLLVTISAFDGHYFPVHASTFCKATHIQCTEIEKEPEEHTQSFWPLYLSARQTEARKESNFWPLYLSARQTEVRKWPLYLSARQTEVRKESNFWPLYLSTRQTEVGKESEASSQAKRPLTSGSVHEISTYFFREKQVLASGVDIRVELGGYNVDAEGDRAFLPRKLAKLFPLRGDGAKIASMLGVSQEDLQQTLDACNAGHDTIEEVRMCLTSIEDVADFVAAVLGASADVIQAYDGIINASRAELEKAGNTFHVLHLKELTADLDEPSVICHDRAFPFRLFYCHYAKQTKIFQVTLRGEDKSSHERIAVCHYDTSYWNPQHVSFTELQTKPGESEACHWLGGTWLGHTGWVFVRGAAAASAAVI